MEMTATDSITTGDMGALYAQYIDAIRRHISRLTNGDDPEDLAQDTFTKAYQAIANGAVIPLGAVSSWLYRIATNTTIDAMRRRQIIRYLSIFLIDDNDDLLSNNADDERGVIARDLLHTVWEQLPTKYQICIILADFHGYIDRQCAEILGISTSAFKMRRSRARREFIEIYQKENNL